MNGDEIAAHPYYQTLKAAGVPVPHTGVTNQPFWTYVLGDWTRLAAELAGARADVENLGAQLTAASEALDLARRPRPDESGAARPLTQSAQEALALALTRSQSELEPRVLFPGECSQAVVEELIDHDLAVLHGPTMQQFESGDWWHLTIAEARLTPLARTVRIDPEPNP